MDADNKEIKETNQEDPKESNYQNYYYIIPAILVENTPTPYIGMLFGLLVSYCTTNNYCVVSNTFLANKLKTPTNSIKLYLKYLVNNKWIKTNLDQENNTVRKIYLLR